MSGGLYAKGDSYGYDVGCFELVDSKFSNKTMEKKIYKFLAVNKKTNKVDKNEVVVAENEQTAILKAFGVDVENVFSEYSPAGLIDISKAINEIMDYLEKNLPVKNGKFWKCKNCDHVTGYRNEQCCAEPDYEEYDD